MKFLKCALVVLLTAITTSIFCQEPARPSIGSAGTATKVQGRLYVEDLVQFPVRDNIGLYPEPLRPGAFVTITDPLNASEVIPLFYLGPDNGWVELPFGEFVDTIFFSAQTGSQTLIYQKTGVDYPFYTFYFPDGIIDPGYVTWSGTGLTYNITATTLRVNGVVTVIPAGQVTLDPADDDDPRYDNIYVDETGFHVLTGTPSPDPSTPVLEGDQFHLAFAFVAAGATEPIVPNLIWDENSESSTVSVTGAGATVDPDYAGANVYHLTKAFDLSNINHNDAVNISRVASWSLANPAQSINMYIKLKAVMPSSATIRMRLDNGAIPIINEYTLPVDRSNTTSFQAISVPIGNLGTPTSLNFTNLRLRYVRPTSGAVFSGFYGDYFFIDESTTTPNPAGSIGLDFAGNAFDNISGSPTANGTITVNTTGNSGQYIDGAFNLQTFPTLLTTMGALDGRSKTPEGATIDLPELFLQTVDTDNPGIVTGDMFDRWEAQSYLQNLGDLALDSLLMPIDANTNGIKTLKDSLDFHIIDYGTHLTMWVDATGGSGSQTLQEVFDQEVGGSVLTKNDTILLADNTLYYSDATLGSYYSHAPDRYDVSIENTGGLNFGRLRIQQGNLSMITSNTTNGKIEILADAVSSQAILESDTLTLDITHNFTADTTNYKPLVIHSGGRVEVANWSTFAAQGGIDDVLEVGQVLTTDREIDMSSNTLYIHGNDATQGVLIHNTGSGFALGAFTYGNNFALEAGTLGNTASIHAKAGNISNGVLNLEMENDRQAIIKPMVISRSHTANNVDSTAANGFGTAYDTYLENDNEDEIRASRIITKMSDVTDGSEDSEVEIWGLVNGVETLLTTFGGGGGPVTTPTLQEVFDEEVGGSVLSKADSILSDSSIHIIGKSTNGSEANLYVHQTDASGFGNAIRGTSNAINATGYFENTKTSAGGGWAIVGTAVGVNSTASFFRDSASTNTIMSVLSVTRTSSGTPAAGIGASMAFAVETDASNQRSAGDLQYFYSSAADVTRTSEVNIRGINSGTTEIFANFQTGGIVRVNNLADTLATKAYARSVGGGGGVTTMAAIGSSPNADGATISGTTLTLQPANSTFGGVVTTGTQNFEGEKFFNDIIHISDLMEITYTNVGSSPATGKGWLHAKTSDKKLYWMDDTGLEYDLTATGTSFTDELAQDAIGTMVDASLNYVDGTPLLQRAALTGDVTASAGSNTTAIAAGVIVNADINSSAAIDASKIHDGTVSNTEFKLLDGTLGIAKGFMRDTLTIAGISTFIPRYIFYDEFTGATNNTTGSTFLSELASGSGANAAQFNLTTLPTGATAVDGMGYVETGTTTTGKAILAGYGATNGNALGKVDNDYYYRCEFKNVIIEDLSDGTNTYKLWIGFGVDNANTNGCWFTYTDGENSGGWIATSYNATTPQTTNLTTVNADTEYDLAVEVYNQVVKFYINGSLVATHSTQVPPAAGTMQNVIFKILKSAGGTTRRVFVDAIGLRVTHENDL